MANVLDSRFGGDRLMIIAADLIRTGRTTAEDAAVNLRLLVCRPDIDIDGLAPMSWSLANLPGVVRGWRKVIAFYDAGRHSVLVAGRRPLARRVLA